MEETIGYCLSRSAWSQYKTAWKHLVTFLEYEGYTGGLPVPEELIVKFLLYLHRSRTLSYSTIKNYMAGLKFIHGLAGSSTEAFKSFLVRKMLVAIHNKELSLLKEKPPNRCALTFPTLAIFGDELLSSMTYHPWTRLNIWAASLLSYSSGLRLGDYLPDSHGIDIPKILTWDKFRVIEEDHLTFVIILPKNTKAIKKQGDAKDVTRFPDPRFCPVSKILKILAIRLEDPDFDWYEPVFTKSNGRPLYTYDVNRAMSLILDPIYGDKFSGHSFRSGVTSVMAENYDKFTLDNVKQHGGWRGDESIKLYSRRAGVGIKATKDLINSLTI